LSIDGFGSVAVVTFELGSQLKKDESISVMNLQLLIN